MKVAILMGSPNDQDKMAPAAATLEEFGVEAEVHVMSAHRTPAKVAAFASGARANGYAALICGAGMAAHLAEGGEVSAPLAAAFANRVEPEDPANDALLARHHAWIAKMWDRACPPEAYAGLADLYLAHPDFRTQFDKNGEGFLDWMTTAMKAYAARLAA